MARNHKYYRRIYKQHHGAIPTEPDGRSYEIHHRDGNHENNSPENLVAVTIQEHYDIHASQGDWYACLKIAAKMKLSNEELSEIARKNNQRMLSEGIHPLMKRSDGSSHATDRIRAGNWHFSRRPDGTSAATDRFENGTHALANYKGEKHFNYDHTVYCFKNRVSGQLISATQYEFSKMGMIPRNAISKIVHKHKKSYKDWVVIFESLSNEVNR